MVISVPSKVSAGAMEEFNRGIWALRGDSVSHLWEVWAQREAQRVCSEFSVEQDGSSRHRGALEQGLFPLTTTYLLLSALPRVQGWWDYCH